MLDVAVQKWISRIVDSQRCRYAHHTPSLPGDPQRLHFGFSGYNGHRNTGSDVRVEEMLRQVRRIFGPERVRQTVVSFNQNLTRGYFEPAEQITPMLLPTELHQDFTRYDVVVACEGSTFTSKFTDLLSAMMVGIIGAAAAQNVPTVAYGAEADQMNPLLEEMVSRYCRDSLLITRNRQSQVRLGQIGLTSQLGTDTAWTFEPHPQEYAERELKKFGWRGEPVLVLCPINPYWWPVHASLVKSLARLIGRYEDTHHSGILFMNSGQSIEARFETYLNAWADAVRPFCSRTKAFPIVAASEKLDNIACRRLAQKLGGAPMFSASDYDMFELVSILRTGRWMLSSRYHAILTSMPGGVASAGVTMDQRIASLMEERGHAHLLAHINDDGLAAQITNMLESLEQDDEEIVAQSSRTVVRHLGIMSQMGRRLQEYLSGRYPEFGPRSDQTSWAHYLPELGPTLEALLADHGEPESSKSMRLDAAEARRSVA